MIPLIPKHNKLGEGFSKIDYLGSAEHPGRRVNALKGYQSAAGWVIGLIDLRKPVILCGYCRHKFDPKHARYRRFFCLDSTGQNGYVTNGQCDDCKQDTRRSPGGGTMFISEESYSQICQEPPAQRRSVRARMSFAGQTAWGVIQQTLRR
jgi:hypothetical protein